MLDKLGIQWAYMTIANRVSGHICARLIDIAPATGLVTPTERPTAHGAEESTARAEKRVRDILNDAYEAIGQKGLASPAFQLIRPHLRDKTFRDELTMCIDALDGGIHRQVPMLDLLLEAHEFTLPGSDSSAEALQPELGMRLMDVVQKREEYLPVTNERSFFIFGKRLDVEFGVQSYQDAFNQLVPDSEWSMGLHNALNSRMIILQLVLHAANRRLQCI